MVNTLTDNELQIHPSKLLEVLWDKSDYQELLSHPSKKLGVAEVDRFDSMQPRCHPNIVYQVELVDRFAHKQL